MRVEVVYIYRAAAVLYGEGSSKVWDIFSVKYSRAGT